MRKNLKHLTSANPKKWSNTLEQPTNRLSVFDHFVGLRGRPLLFLLCYHFLGLIQREILKQV